MKRKKKLFGFWIRRFFLIMLVVLLCGGSQLQTFWKEVDEYCRANSSHWFSDEGGDTRKKNMEASLSRAESKEEISPRLSLIANSLDTDDNLLMLFQPETGEYYFNRPLGFTTARINGEMTKLYLTDQDLIKQIYEFEGDDHNWGITAYSIYVKGNEFLPGEVFVRPSGPWGSIVELYHWDISPYKEGDQYVGKWVDLSPEDTEGWTKLCAIDSKDELITYHNWTESDDDEAGDEADYFSGECIQLINASEAPHAEAAKKCIESSFDDYTSLINEIGKGIRRAKYDNEQRLKRELTEEEFTEMKNKAESMYPDGTDYDYSEWYDYPDDEGIWKIGQCETYENYQSAYRENAESYLESALYQCWHLPTSLLRSIDYSPYVCYDVECLTYQDQEWGLLHYEYYDPVKEFKERYAYDIFWQSIQAAIVALIASFIWAVIAHLRYSKKYEIAAYRRNITGALAHDLKTPLAAISGYAENLREHTHPEKADSYADSILQSVQHMDEIIVGTLELTKLEDTRLPKKEMLDFTEILHEAFSHLSADMQFRGLKLKESGSFIFKGNPDLIRQLCDNLASNVLHHAAEGGQITVTATKRWLTISNPYTGELDAKTLLNPFRRGDEARGRHSGSGLGLSMIHNIANLHRLKLKLTAQNGIFTISIKIPLLLYPLTKPKRRPKKQKMDLAACLKESFSRLDADMQMRGLKLKTSGSLTVKAKPEEVQQLCDQLATNAVRYTKEGGNITVSAKRHQITVSNPYTGTLDVKALTRQAKIGKVKGKHGGNMHGLAKIRTITDQYEWFLKLSAEDGMLTVKIKTGGFYV